MWRQISGLFQDACRCREEGVLLCSCTPHRTVLRRGEGGRCRRRRRRRLPGELAGSASHRKEQAEKRLSLMLLLPRFSASRLELLALLAPHLDPLHCFSILCCFLFFLIFQVSITSCPHKSAGLSCLFHPDHFSLPLSVQFSISPVHALPAPASSQ